MKIKRLKRRFVRNVDRLGTANGKPKTDSICALEKKTLKIGNALAKCPEYSDCSSVKALYVKIAKKEPKKRKSGKENIYA